MHVIYSTLIQELHNFAKSHQYERAVLGLSGGLDSAVVLNLSVRAFGAKNVTALILPEMGITPPEDIEHAKMLADYFDCPMHFKPINNFLVDYHFLPWDKSVESEENLKTRIRSTLLNHCAEGTGSMVLGTANKSDLQLGLGSLDGEFTGTLHVLGDLYKSDVVTLAQYIGLPAELIETPFSRHLKMDQSDEGDWAAPWSKMDEILRQFEDKVDPDSMIEKGMDALLVHKLARLVHENEALAKSIPVIRVGRVTESIKKAQKAEAESLS